MRTTRVAALSIFLPLALFFAITPIALAGEYRCEGGLAGTTVDNLRVLANTYCTLVDVQVQGTMIVENGASLTASNVTVTGNVQADGAESILLGEGVQVSGSVQIKQSGVAILDKVHINGNLQLEANRDALQITRNQITGSFQLVLNQGDITLANNTIGGNLQCSNNRAAPIGGNNQVKGGTDGQCGGLNNENFTPNQIVVKLDMQSDTAITAINATYGTSTQQTLLASGGIYLLQTPAGLNIEQLLAQMQKDSRLIYAEPNFIGELPEGGGRGKWAWGGDDPSPVGVQYAAALLELTKAHKLSRGEDVIIAVLDTGFQLDHPRLDDRLTRVRYDFVDDDANPTEDFANLDRNGDGLVDESAGHGTHVAGIISLAAPKARIMPVRVLDANGRGNVFLIAEAIAFAARNGAQVINLSLGTRGHSQLLREVIADVAARYDVVIVGAAGNLNSASPIFPAAEAEVLAVSAVDANKRRSDFANYGPWVDIAAPGDAIYSAFPRNSFAYWSGTSMATPFIAAQAALIASRNSSLTALDIRRCILITAQPLTAELGAGLADFVDSLRAAEEGCVDPDTRMISASTLAPAGVVEAVRLYFPVVLQQ